LAGLLLAGKRGPGTAAQTRKRRFSDWKISTPCKAGASPRGRKGREKTKEDHPLALRRRDLGAVAVEGKKEDDGGVYRGSSL